MKTMTLLHVSMAILVDLSVVFTINLPSVQLLKQQSAFRLESAAIDRSSYTPGKVEEKNDFLRWSPYFVRRFQSL